MPTFAYVAKDKAGARVEGTLDAEGRQAVVARLQQMGYFPLQIAPTTKGAKPAAPPPAAPAPKKPEPPRVSKTAVPTAGLSSSAVPRQAAAAPAAAPSAQRGGFTLFKAISAADLANFNRQMADLLGAGIPLVKALSMLNRQTDKESLRVVITQILDDVQAGATFADALAKHPQVFSKLYIAMVKSGEAGGMLDEVLKRLADYSENEEQLKGKVKSALAYPAVMIIAGSGAIAVMFIYVIPKITGTFKSLGQTLPAITVLLIQISEAVQYYWWMMLLGGVAGVALFLQYIRTPEGKAAWDQLQLRIPVVGSVVQKREVARFTRTLGSLLRNGVSILSALDIVREVVNNTVVRQDVERVIEEITQGSSIATPLRQSPVFPPVAINMIAIGEETGRLPEVLLRISESYEIQVERSVRTLTSLIEPLIIVAMGLVVGFIVIAMLLPIFSLDPTGGTK